MSGGYDHTVKVWDSRQTNPVFSLEHDGPVESVLFLQSGTLMLSTSGNEIKIWDVLNSGRLLHTFNNHLKNITSLCTTNGDKKLLSSGLDGLVKVYDMQTLQVVHSMKYDTPVMCVSVSPRDKKLVIGCTNGQLLIKNKRVDSDSNDTDIGIGVTNILRKNRLYKGAGVANGTIDGQTRTGVIETERTSRLLPYEKFLQKFNYQKALDAALKTRNPLVVITVFEELCRRSGLTIALSGREDVSLEPIVSFCARYINNPRYSRVLIQVTHKVLDLYANVLGHSDAIDQLFMKLQKQVKVEVQFQREIMRVMGSLDGIISAAMNGSSAIDSAIDNATNNTTNLIGNNDNMALISSFN